MIDEKLKQYCTKAINPLEKYGLEDEISNQGSILSDIVKQAKKDGIIADISQKVLPDLSEPNYSSKEFLLTLADAIRNSENLWHYNRRLALNLIFGLEGGAWKTLGLKNPND